MSMAFSPSLPMMTGASNVVSPSLRSALSDTWPPRLSVGTTVKRGQMIAERASAPPAAPCVGVDLGEPALLLHERTVRTRYARVRREHIEYAERRLGVV